MGSLERTAGSTTESDQECFEVQLECKGIFVSSKLGILLCLAGALNTSCWKM